MIATVRVGRVIVTRAHDSFEAVDEWAAGVVDALRAVRVRGRWRLYVDTVGGGLEAHANPHDAGRPDLVDWCLRLLRKWRGDRRPEHATGRAISAATRRTTP